MSEAKPSRCEAWLQAQNRHPVAWLVVFAAALAAQISPWWMPTPDATGYLSIARALAQSHRLRNLGSVHLAYPPGYPILISPAFLLSNHPFLWLSILQWILAVGFMIGVWRWARRLAPEAALLVAGLCVLNAGFGVYYRRTLSEISFMTVMIWTVMVLDRALDAGRHRARVIGACCGTALLIALALIREAGVVFAAGFVLVAAQRARRGRLAKGECALLSAIVCAPVGAGVATFLIYDQITKRAGATILGTHLNGFTERATPLAARVAEGLRLEISECGRLVIPGMFKAYASTGAWLNPAVLLYVAIFIVLALGWRRMTRANFNGLDGNLDRLDRLELMGAALPLYFVLYVLWSFDAGTRYMLPMLPVLMLCLWFGLSRLGSGRVVLMTALLALHLAVATGYWATVEIPRARECNRNWAPLQTLAAHLPASADGVAATPEVAQCARLMMTFLIDRPIPIIADQFSAANFILAPAAGKPPPGFATGAAAANFKLFERQSNSPGPANSAGPVSSANPAGLAGRTSGTSSR